MKEQERKARKKRLGLLSKVQSPDDLELGTIIPEQSKGSPEQFVKEESPDDLEIAKNEPKHK